jgi:ATP-dependent DNA ligase
MVLGLHPFSAPIYNQIMQQFSAICLAVPTRVPAPFDDPVWVFELKHDGFRAMLSCKKAKTNASD